MRGPTTKGALAAILVALVVNGAISTDVCRTGCKGGDNQIFKYAVGTTYKYNYQGEIGITLASAEGQSTNTQVKATVLLSQLPDCNQLLRLQNVQIIGSDGKSLGAIPDVEKPVRLNFHDGHLEDSICVEEGDNQNSINLKRAIASAFQADVKSSHETDFFGLCPTQFVQNAEGGSTVNIQKRRSLNKCAYRENIRQDFLATTFNADSEIKSSPILDAHYNAKQKINNGVLESASIVEDYLYVPFSVGQNGARAQVNSKLTLAGTSKDSPQVNTDQPRSIIFENPHQVVAPGNNVHHVVDALKNVAKTVDVVVGETTAREFVKLLKIVRGSSKDTILGAFNQVQSGAGITDKDAAKRLLLDAILRAGTGESVEASIALLKNNQLEELDQKLVYLGLSLVRHASEASLVAAGDLLGQKNLPREAYLGVGNLAGRFCRQHSCKNVDAVHKLAQKLVSKLGSASTKKREEENDTIYVLKALANFHVLEDGVVTKIASIAQDEKAPNRLRVAALQALLADPCKDKVRDAALKILQDIQQDSEIRIRAYLTLARCPNAKIGNAVKALLAEEESIQVGGFIESHIRSLKASANPDKALARQHLGFRLANKFPIDPRKYSYNSELSYSVDTLGLAAATEADIIYSQDSWLPRSSSLNLTTQIFGHTFNFLEVQTRQENLDKLVEHYFGPKGVLRNSNLKDVYEEGQKEGSGLLKNLRSKIDADLKRHKRDVSKADIDKIGKQIQVTTNALNRDLDLDLSVKAFGSEVLFLNVNQDVRTFSPEEIIERIVRDFSKGLDQIKDFEKTLRSNLVFLDGEFSYPTSLGFPLRLAVEGTASLQLKTEGKVDVRSLFDSTENGQLKLKLIPSANIEISGRLTLDALVVENGLKVVSNLYSGVGGDLNVEWSDHGRNFDVKFGVPVQEQKLVSVSHEIVFHSREQSGKESNQPLKFAQNKDFSICLDQLSTVIGLTFCAEINGPNLAGKQVPVLPFPFAGDAKLAVSIENDDVSEYHLKVRQGSTSSELLLETVGKNKQSKASVSFLATIQPEKLIRGILSAPGLKLKLLGEVQVVDNENEKVISIKSDQNGQVYSGRIGFLQSGNSDKTTYKPIIEYKTPQGPYSLPIQVEGQITYERRQDGYKITFDGVKIKDEAGKSVSLTGNAGVQDKAIFAHLTVSDGSRQASLNGKLQVSQELLKFNGEFQNTLNPNVNFNAKGEIKKSPDNLSTNLQLIHGKDLTSKTNILTLSSSVTRDIKSPTDFHIATKNKFTYPLFGIETKLEWDVKPKNLEYEVEIQYSDAKIGSCLKAEINKKTVGDYDVEFELEGLDNKVKLEAKREIQGDESKIDHELEVNDKKLEVKGKVRHLIKPDNVDVGAELTIVLPTHSEPFKVSSGVKYDRNEFDGHHKITSGSQVVLDAFLKTTKGGNANGNIKVNLIKILVVNGQIKSNKGNGNGDILFDLQGLKRQLKAETTFNAQPGEVFNVEVTLYPVYDQDKNKKIVLSTNTKTTTSSVDSKNIVDFLGNKLEVNIKGSNNVDKNDRKTKAELEVTLPNEHYFLAKTSYDEHESNNLYSGQSQGILECRKFKNSPGKRIAYESTWKNTNIKTGNIDVAYKLSADDSNGSNLNADVVFVQTKKGEEYSIDWKSKAYGSLLRDPVEANVVAECNKVKGQFTVKLTNGPNAAITIGGTHDAQEGKPLSGSLQLNVLAPSKEFKVLNVGLTGSATNPEQASNSVALQGAIQILVDDDGTNPGAILELKGEGQVTATPDNGVIVGRLNIGKESPLGVDVRYTKKEEGENKQGSGSAEVIYGQGKNIKVVADAEQHGENTKINLEVLTPVEGYKDTKLSITAKGSLEKRNIESTLNLVQDGKTWTGEADLSQSDTTSLIDLKLRCPEGKNARIYFKSNKASDKKYDAELKIINEAKDFLFEATSDVDVQSVEDFTIKHTINSPNLKLDKYVFEAYNKPGSSDRKIQVIIKLAGKNLISGSTNYNAREENGKYIVEGSGSFKVKDETQSGSFKYISERLKQQKNEEEGVEISFVAALGQKGIDSEFKATNKHFRMLHSVCEQKKDCVHLQIDSKVESNDLNNYNHVLEVNVDLRKLGLPHEFGLKSVTTRKDWQVDHTAELYFQSEKEKYQYSVYVHPTESAVILTTPKRIVALEAKLQQPQNVWKGGKATGELAFYLDKKNHANKKTSLSGSLESSTNSINGELKLNHPGLAKPLSASFKATGNKNDVNFEAVLDIFAKPDQKIVTLLKSYAKGDIFSKFESRATLEIKSAGLGVDILASDEFVLDKNAKSILYEEKVVYSVGSSKYDSIESFRASPSEVSVLLKLLNVDILKAVHKLKTGRDELIVDSEVSSYDNEPITSHFELKNWNTLKYSVGYKKTPENKLQLNAGLIPGQIADLRADVYSSNKKTNLFFATLKLDDANFLKPDYNLNSEQIQAVLKECRRVLLQRAKGLGDVGKEWVNDIKKEGQNLGGLAKKAAPNLTPMRTYYSKELKEIKDEILEDKNVKQLSELIQNILAGIVSATSEIIDKLSNLAEQIAKAVEAAFQGVLDTIEKQLVPQVKQIAEKLVGVATDVLDSVADIVLGVVAKITKIVEQYQPELKQIAASLGELTQDVGRFVQKAYENAREIVYDQWQRIYEEIRALPIVEQLKEQYKEFANTYKETIVSTLNEVVTTLKDAVPHGFVIQEEIYNALDNIVSYVEKKLNGKPVSDLDFLQKLAQTTLTALKKVFKAISNEDIQLPGGLSLSGAYVDLWDSLPRLVAAKFSPIEYLAEEDLTKQVAALLLSLVNTPRNWMPPFPLFGMVVQGQHIFTFDGKHITFPGNCDYVLARDAVNGNFTIVGTLKNGELTAITLADNKDTVTLLKGGNVKLNNDATNLPARKQDIAAHRDYQMVTLRTTSGVVVTCSPELTGCVVRLSGFYHGQVRGLLGNGNNEPFDDFTLADGEIVAGESEFGNSYKVQSSCAAATTPDHQDVQVHADCAKLFKDDDLAICGPFVSNENFKVACSHGLQAGVKDTELNVAKAYVAACRNRNVPAETPGRLLKCTNGDKTYNFGDTFSVKLPGKAADVVLLVETEQDNEQKYKELFQPVVQDISKELHAKGINDVEFHLIAYGGENQWPSHVTVNGKLTFKGKAPNIKFAKGQEESYEVPEGYPQLRKLVENVAEAVRDLRLATGAYLASETFAEGYGYPFRAHALKSVVVLNSEQCEVGKLRLLQKLRALLFKNEQISLNLFTPVPTLDVKDGKKTKDVIGFNSDSAFLISQGKKSPRGSTEIRSDISYDDYCIDFTLKNRGNVFVNENFVNAKADQKKTFVHVAAVNIVNEMTNVEQGLDCECDSINPWAAQNQCTVAYTQPKKSTKSRS